MTKSRRPTWTVRPAKTLELNSRKFAKVAKSHEWMTSGSFDYSRVAAELGISLRQAYRVLDRESRPGTGFIGGLMGADQEIDIRDLFDVVDLHRLTSEE